jgi:hypothetical protein
MKISIKLNALLKAKRKYGKTLQIGRFPFIRINVNIVQNGTSEKVK